MENRKKGPTIRYGLIQAGYWMDYLVLASFAAVFLAGRGFSTQQIGTVLALGSLFSCIFSQISGTIADKTTKPLKWFVALFVGVCMLCFIGLKLIPDNYVSTFIFYMTASTMQSAVQPLINSLCLDFTNNGYDINFGVSRSMGSLGYAVSALVMGTVTDKFGAEIIVPIYLAVYAAVMVILIFFPVPKKDANAEIIAGNELLKDEKPSTMKEFFHKYHRFMVLMLGFIFLWFMNNILGSYMIYFIRYYHGTATHMGIAFSVMAFSEIPAVLFGNNIMHRIGAGNMLRISAVGGMIKDVLFLVSPNVQCFILAQTAHFLLSGFYQVSAVFYCYSIVGRRDIVKGQSILGICSVGICTLLANYIGGFLVGSVSIPVIYLIGIATSVIALVLIWIATDPKRFPKETIRNI